MKTTILRANRPLTIDGRRYAHGETVAVIRSDVPLAELGRLLVRPGLLQVEPVENAESDFASR